MSHWMEKLEIAGSTLSKILRSLPVLQCPRCYFSPQQIDVTTQLHVFVDASVQAHGAVAYIWQVQQPSFVTAKSRVAPLKQLFLPRLESMAALVGANLAEFLQNALTKKFPATQVTLGSQSQIVLHWHQSNKQIQQFVCYQASLPTHQLAILPYKWQPGCPANKGCGWPLHNYRF